MMLTCIVTKGCVHGAHEGSLQKGRACSRYRVLAKRQHCEGELESI